MRYSERQRIPMEVHWPQTPMNIVLVAPEIPPNTGNIARLCAATGSILHLIDPLGFDISDKAIRRAGLDYWDKVEVRRHADFDAFLNENPNGNKYLFTTAAPSRYTDTSYQPGDYIIFGSESRGLPDDLLERFPEQTRNIPIRLDHVRSLNLSNCAALVLFEALRQIDQKF